MESANTPVAGKAANKGYRTKVLLLLTLVYGFNFIDRQIVGILAPWIQADLSLTNTELGLLVGLAFAAFYTIMGIPLAFLSDRMNRVTLLSLALAVWSGFTALTGYAQNFTHIALARVGVGIGEAGGSPPSHSMISDFYAKEERAGALGIYSLGIPVGIMAAYFLTAALLGADAETVNWRKIFITLGGFGILLAIIVRLAIREPERGAMETSAKPPSGYISLKQSFSQSNLTPRIGIFGGLLALLIAAWALGHMSIVFVIPFAIFLMALGIAFASFASYAISGFQTKFLRLLEPDFSPRVFIVWIGIINGTFYVAGTYFGAKLVDIKAKTDIRAYGTIPAIAILLAAPLAYAAFWAPSITVHLAVGAILQLCLGVYLGPSFAIAQTLAGPTFAGAMIDVFLNKGETELNATRLAMYVTFGAYALSFMFYMFVRKTLPEDWAAAQARNESGT